MMRIELQKLHKRYQFEPIFGQLDYIFEQKKSYAITGANGSGKSTLLKMIAGLEAVSDGNIQYTYSTTPLPKEALFRHLSIVAPYQEIPEELTLNELIDFHSKLIGIPKATFIDAAKEAGLKKALNRQLVFFSSGMKQRAKLVLALFSDAPLMLLDEPCNNLDKAGIEWYRNCILQHHGLKTIIISSNASEEYDFCDHVLSIEEYK